MNDRRRISPKQLAALGWTRFPGTFHPSFEHIDGWGLRHCHHPTAHYPWTLFSPAGYIILTGAAGPESNPDFGTHWPTLTAAVEYVATQTTVKARTNDPKFTLQFAGEPLQL